eukprot:gene20537-biopygen17585
MGGGEIGFKVLTQIDVRGTHPRSAWSLWSLGGTAGLPTFPGTFGAWPAPPDTRGFPGSRGFSGVRRRRPGSKDSRSPEAAAAARGLPEYRERGFACAGQWMFIWQHGRAPAHLMEKIGI